MKRTSVAELKARLSYFLRLAQEGETIEVQSHRHPVARIMPAQSPSESLIILPGRSMAELKSLTGVRIAARADPVAALLHDRASR
jgi:prevent-host-death family protein